MPGLFVFGERAVSMVRWPAEPFRRGQKGTMIGGNHHA